MNPPLRSEPDRLAVRQGLADGTLDCIATDHAPHSPEEKAAGLEKAPNGIIGLETALAVSLSLVADGTLSLAGLIAKMSTQPARILGVSCGLKPGMPADITLIDPVLPFTIDPSCSDPAAATRRSSACRRSRKAVLTMVGGRVVFEDNPADF
jgi:dihydroorotase